MPEKGGTTAEGYRAPGSAGRTLPRTAPTPADLSEATLDLDQPSTSRGVVVILTAEVAVCANRHIPASKFHRSLRRR
jgi:hypothetical protein